MTNHSPPRQSMPPDETPAMATYRLQLNREFGLRDARELVPYLARLGITHLYLSPILRARPHSIHGYDVVDPRVLNPELGDEADLNHFIRDLRQFGLAMLLDIVPNHMAASFENPYWRDVLTYGRASPFAGWFDINWRMPDPELWGRVLVPVLGAPSRAAIEQDHLSVSWSESRFLVRYFDHVFPLDPATVPSICASGLPRLRELLGEDHPAMARITGILARLRRIPGFRSRQRRQVTIDRDQIEAWLAELAQQFVQSPRTQEWAEETAARFSQGPEGRLRLKRLLGRQPYRLVYWRRAARLLNYRRFFDINELISVRQEDPQVFAQTHATIFRWIEEGLVDGLRIDHVDGLRDPAGYLNRLIGSIPARPGQQAAFPVFVEKILAPGEPLPPSWPVRGTTGYDFLNQAESILISNMGFAEIVEEYRRMLRRPVHFQQMAAWGKRRVLRSDLSAPAGRLAQQLFRLAYPDGHRSAIASPPAPSLRDLLNAVVEVVVALPVYRTYADPTDGTFGEIDAHYLRQAMQAARRSGRATAEAVDLIESILLPDPGNPAGHGAQSGRLHFIERFQQLSGPAAAKGIEDTALYAFVPLVPLNEVGGEPRMPAEPSGPSLSLHRANAERASLWPSALLAVTTHDTKRSADVRARLDVLSEMPGTWWRLVRRWRRLNRPLRSVVRGRLAPDATSEYLFYQTVAGIWPIPDPDRPDRLPGKQELSFLSDRISAYMLKAVREAKTWTSWTRGDPPYEDAVLTFVRKALRPSPPGKPGFLSGLQALVSRIARPGLWNSLSRTIIQFTAPGAPDLYQGDEIWNFALVDPDNRRPVDYAHRQRLLDDIILAWEDSGQPGETILGRWLSQPEDGKIKLHLIHRLLRARRDHPSLFGSGSYEPLKLEGPLASHVFGFSRRAGQEAAIVLAARLMTGLAPRPEYPPAGPSVWPDGTAVKLPSDLGDILWSSPVTGETVASIPSPSGTGCILPLSELFAHLPVAVLIGQKE